MTYCVNCKANKCLFSAKNKNPDCTMNIYRDCIEQAKRIYKENEEIRKWAKNASIVEAEGYNNWPRLIDTIEFAKRMNYKKIGIACCIGLLNEAKRISQIFENYEFENHVVMCKAGGLKKSELGLKEEHIGMSKTGYMIGTVLVAEGKTDGQLYPFQKVTHIP